MVGVAEILTLVSFSSAPLLKPLVPGKTWPYRLDLRHWWHSRSDSTSVCLDFEMAEHEMVGLKTVWRAYPVVEGQLYADGCGMWLTGQWPFAFSGIST